MTKRTAMRSYKKRRTLRKMKRTMRRKLQRGGGTESFVVIIFLAIASTYPPFRMIINIFLLFFGSKTISIGGGKKFRQSGGGRFSDALIKFDDYVQANSDGTFTDDDKKNIKKCVKELTADPVALDNDLAAPESPNAAVNAAADAFPTPKLTELTSEGMKNYILGIKEKIIKYINAKLDAKGITEDKRECMNKIIDICIRVLFDKISKLDLTRVISDNYKQLSTAIEEAGKEKFGQFAEKGKGMLSAFSKSDGAQSALSLGRDVMGKMTNLYGNLRIRNT